MPQARSAAEPSPERSIVVTRTFDAPARLVFEACSKPEYVAQWFGPRGWPITLCEIDFRLGGRYRFAMTGPSGQQNTPFGGEYLEIVPDQKIVFDNTFEEPGAETLIVTMTFEEQDEQTTLTIHTLFSSVEARDVHLKAGYVQGTDSGLDQLADVLAAMRAKERA